MRIFSFFAIDLCRQRAQTANMSMKNRGSSFMRGSSTRLAIHEHVSTAPSSLSGSRSRINDIQLLDDDDA